MDEEEEEVEMEVVEDNSVHPTVDQEVLKVEVEKERRIHCIVL